MLLSWCSPEMKQVHPWLQTGGLVVALFLLYPVCKQGSSAQSYSNFCPFPFLQHHHDHLLHSPGPGLDAPVPVDLQPALDRHSPGAVTAHRDGDPDPLQHPHPHRFGRLHPPQIQPGGRLHCEGKVTVASFTFVEGPWSLTHSRNGEKFGKEG